MKTGAIIAHVKSVTEVNPPTVLKFTADGDVRDRFEKQIGERVMSLMEIRWPFRIGVVNVQHGIADRTGETLAPGVIDERNHAQQRQGHACDGRDRIAEIVFDGDVDRCVIHVFLYAAAVNNLELAAVLWSEIE